MEMPLFSKTLKLLHSNAKDAEEQLKNLLEEVVKQKYGISKTFSNFFNKKDPKRESSSKSSSRKEERKSFEKHSDDSSESVSSSKRSKIESKSSSHSHSEPSTPLNQAIIDLIDVEPVKKEPKSDEDEDFNLEILEEELTCVVCRGMEVGVRNQLVECLECHSLYHQECHKPPVSEEDMNDPRSAWYCANCATNLNKPLKQGARSSPKLISAKQESSHSHNIFKRSESKSSSQILPNMNKSSTSPTPIGMAGLAASYQPAKNTYSSSSKSSSKNKKRF